MRFKGGSFLFTRCHSDLATVGGHDSFGNEKPKVEPGLLALDLILILPAWQRVKNGGDNIGGNSAFIMNGQDHFLTRPFRRNVNRRGLQSVQDRTTINRAPCRSSGQEPSMPLKNSRSGKRQPLSCGEFFIKMYRL